MNPEDIITLDDGRRFHIEGYSQLTPEQQEQRVRQLRVDQAASEIVESERGMREQLGTQADMGTGLFGLGETRNAFAHGMTLGIPELIAAGAQIPINWIAGEASPTHGMTFPEIRDTFRAANALRREEAPPVYENVAIPVAEVAGMLSTGANLGRTILPNGAVISAAPATGARNAALQGGLLGSAAGVGTSDAESLGGYFRDALLGGAGGAATGVAADYLLRGLGTIVNRALGRPDSADALRTQRSLGMRPSVGSVGNEVARSLENSFSEAPFVAAVSRALPGQSTGQVQQGQREVLEGVAGRDPRPNIIEERVTGPMQPEGRTPPQTDQEMIPSVIDTADSATGQYRGDIARIENEGVARLAPPGSPVPLGPVRRVPGDLENEFRAPGVVSGARDIVSTVDEAATVPVRNNLNASLNRELGAAEAARDAALAAGDTAAARRAETRIRNIQRRIYNNMGAPFQTVRDIRTEIGPMAEQGGFSNIVEGVMYEPFTRAMEQGVRRANIQTGGVQAGREAVSEFRRFMEAEKETFDLMRAVRPYSSEATTGQNSAIAGRIRRAVMGGNWGDLDAIMGGLGPSQRQAFQADLINMLGRRATGSNNRGLDIGALAANWSAMPRQARQRLFQDNPEGLAIMNAIGSVADDLRQRGAAANHSNSATAAGVMAGLGAAVASPGYILPFLVAAGGIDRVVASEALARAVAGEPTLLGNLLRRAVYTQSGMYGPTVANAAAMGEPTPPPAPRTISGGGPQ